MKNKMSINLGIKLLFIFLFFLDFTSSLVEKSAKLESLNNCGGEYSGYQYTIVSPNYPNNYTDNEDCIYILRGSLQAKCNQIFHLQFLNFTLRHSYECRKDYLEIGDRSIFCGNVAGIRNYSSKNNTLKLRFHSDNDGNDRGFKILITTLPCPIIVEATKELKKNDTQFSTSIINSDSENIDYKNIYPVYRPNINVKSSSENISPAGNHRTSTKLNTKPIENNNLSDQELKNTQLQPHYQLPIYDAKLFRNKTQPVKISTYFFASPDTDNYSSTSTFNTPEFGIENNKKNVEAIVKAPPSNLLLPIHPHTIFNSYLNEFVNQSDIIHNTPYKSENIDVSLDRNNNKLIFPPRPSNIPPGIPYAPLPGFETQIKTGEVLDNVEEFIDCNGKTNIDATLRASGNTRDGTVPGNNYLPSAFAPRPNIYPSTIYGAPGARDPPTIESIPNIPVNPNIIIDSEVIYPNPNINPGSAINIRPAGFIPTQNVGDIFPGIIPNYNPLIRQCCNNNYATQRFLITSPDFPSLLHSTNFYECIYTIIPSSLNVCRIRFYLKYFNHGSDNEYCVNGHIEIDGRRYCGCKTGLTIVTNVINSSPKIIGVNYSGYPRSKFNGFSIEVTQELCSYNNYPNVSRQKKAINDTIVDEPEKVVAGSSNRTRRHLGYSYPKPSIPFNPIGVQYNSNAGGPIVSGTTAQSRCQALSFVDWTLAVKEVYFRGARCNANNGNGLIPGTSGIIPGNGYPSVPSFPPSGSRPDIVFPGPTFPQPPSIRGNGQPSFGNCQLISVSEGIISSPGYPNPYPNNLNLCYRFLRRPNGCRLLMSILDFDLENTPGCVKDYLLFSNQNSRYCGRSLAGTKTILVFPRNNIIDVRYRTDSYGTGRGFNIGFVQVGCKDV